MTVRSAIAKNRQVHVTLYEMDWNNGFRLSFMCENNDIVAMVKTKCIGSQQNKILQIQWILTIRLISLNSFRPNMYVK